jgi:hypothetical protein
VGGLVGLLDGVVNGNDVEGVAVGNPLGLVDAGSVAPADGVSVGGLLKIAEGVVLRGIEGDMDDLDMLGIVEGLKLGGTVGLAEGWRAHAESQPS